MVPVLLLVVQVAAASSADDSAAAPNCEGKRGVGPCLPSWKPTWDMYRSTFLYVCNTSGLHNVDEAVRFGTVVYDWSNAKALWANAHPMDSQALLTKQAEAVLARDPGIPGQAPRVWVYRNTIKALNWYSSVREKLDDPRYASWFTKFKTFKDEPYPGGTTKAAKQLNASFAAGAPGAVHVPPCDWYDNGTSPRCSGFYHDQSQTPNHPGGGKPYGVDGNCVEQCDCGPTNPCGEYVFDHRGGVVEGRNFTEWFVNEYMITNETLLHRDPVTGKPAPIGLGWLDDSMNIHGPSEEDRNYVADTGASPDEMSALVGAYKASMRALKEKALSMGGFWVQLMDGYGSKLGPSWKCFPKCNHPIPAENCKAVLKKLCVGANRSATPSTWDKLQLYNVPARRYISPQNLTDYTAEFLLTRGPYAMIGYGWQGCDIKYPRVKEWDMDFGVPADDGAACKETGPGTGVFTREYSKATVTWDCATGHGKIITK